MIQSRPSTDAYRSGWERTFGPIIPGVNDLIFYANECNCGAREICDKCAVARGGVAYIDSKVKHDTR